MGGRKRGQTELIFAKLPQADANNTRIAKPNKNPDLSINWFTAFNSNRQKNNR